MSRTEKPGKKVKDLPAKSGRIEKEPEETLPKNPRKRGYYYDDSYGYEVFLPEFEEELKPETGSDSESCQTESDNVTKNKMEGDQSPTE